jgi:hypothetical protein
MIAKHHSGELSVRRTDTVESLGLYWCREVKVHQVRQSTATDYESRLRLYVFPYLGHKKIQDLSGRDIEGWMHSLLAQGKSSASVNGARRVLFQLCKYATRQDLMLHNPVSKTDPLKNDGAKTQVQEPWSLEEASRALKASVGTGLDLFLHLALFTGARRGEILGLQWSDVDLDQGTISICRTLKEERVLNPEGVGTTRLVTDDPKTKAGFRKLGIPAPLIGAFMRHRDHQASLREIAQERWVETNFVLTSSIGTPQNPTNLAPRVNKFFKQNGIRRIRLHDTRHTVAHLSLEGKVRLEALSQALGHSRLEVTKNIYARNVPKLAIEFSEGLADYLAPMDTAISEMYEAPIEPEAKHARTAT